MAVSAAVNLKSGVRCGCDVVEVFGETLAAVLAFAKYRAGVPAKSADRLRASFVTGGI